MEYDKFKAAVRHGKFGKNGTVLATVLRQRMGPTDISASCKGKQYGSATENERVLRERKPTAGSHGTRDSRRAWITQTHADATTIMRRYPRFVDMNDAVSKMCRLLFHTLYYT